MWKQFALIAFEIILVAAVGFFTNLAAAELKINTAYVWIVLIILLLLLVSTTWFRVRLDSGKDSTGWKLAIPEKITFSISLESLRESIKFLLPLLFNGVLFGWLVANASIFAVRIAPELGYTVESAFYTFRIAGTPAALDFEIIGVCAIGFASVIVSKRLSTLIGILFCITSSLTFAITHVYMLRFEYLTITMLWNLVSSLLVTIIGLFLYPVFRIIQKQINEFWNGTLKKSA